MTPKWRYASIDQVRILSSECLNSPENPASIIIINLKSSVFLLTPKCSDFDPFIYGWTRNDGARNYSDGWRSASMLISSIFVVRSLIKKLAHWGNLHRWQLLPSGLLTHGPTLIHICPIFRHYHGRLLIPICWPCWRY